MNAHGWRRVGLVWSAFTASLLVGGCVLERDLGTTTDAGTNVSPPRSSSLVFVTEARYSGNLAREGNASTGSLGADELCASEAKVAGLSGAFRAWISTTGEEASARVGAMGPYRRVDGTTIFPGKVAVGSPLVALSITASGRTLVSADDGAVWTGTEDNRRCADFATASAGALGAIGSALSVDATWTADGRAVRSCDARARLYCFER
jgi:hypothetical protein